jgi:hypothetical protein
MKIRSIIIGLVAGMILPLAGANAGAVFDPGLNQAGAATDLARGVAPTAENFGLTEHDCDKSRSDPHECKQRKCDKDDESRGRMKHDKDGEWEDHHGRCNRDDNHRWCDKGDHDGRHLKHEKDGSWQDHSGRCDTW